ncbi:MAG TPA: GNAT family N-acetyltransferase [Dermatophilaceae bacterium]
MPELHFPTPPLADETLLLRPWREADVPDNLMAFSDLVIQRFSGPQAAPFTEEDARGYFAGQRSARLGGQEVQLALVGPEEEEVVPGSASAYALNLEQRSAVVGYWPEPQARGRGVTSTEVRLLATWGHDAGVGSDRADVWTG